MGTVSSPGGERRGVIPDRAVMWLGHYSVFLLLAAVAASVADDAAGQPSGLLDWIVDAAWLAWVAALLADMGRHREHLCERCIAATPLDPQAAVDCWRRVLRLQHAHGAWIALLGAVVAWDIGSALFRHQPPWAFAVDALVSVIVGASWLVTWQHRRLYPWCPYCRWDGGGHHEVSPDVPAPAATR